MIKIAVGLACVGCGILCCVALVFGAWRLGR